MKKNTNFAENNSAMGKEKVQKMVLTETSYVYHKNKSVKVTDFPKIGNVPTGFTLKNKSGEWPIYLTKQGKYIAFLRSVKAQERDVFDFRGRYLRTETEYIKGPQYSYYITFPEYVDVIDRALGLDRVTFEASRPSARQVGARKSLTPEEEAKENLMGAVLQRASAEHVEKIKNRSPYREYLLERAKWNWREGKRKKYK